MKSRDVSPTLGNRDEDIANDLQRHYNFTLGRVDSNVQPPYLLKALSMAVRDRLMERWRLTREKENDNKSKRVYYLSLEFLLGRSLTNAVRNIGIEQSVAHALERYGSELETLESYEIDAGLGNGGLGRLAACF